MANVHRFTVRWNGFTGAPGYTRLSFSCLTQADVDLAGTDIRVFFLAVAPYLQTTWSLTFDNVIDVYDEVTGTLVNQMTYTTPPATIVGTATAAAYSGGVGAWISWKTSTIWQGHRVQGRTFLVPLSGVAQTDGTISPGVITALNAAGGALAGSVNSILSVWSRQFTAPPKPQQINGFLAPVTSAVVPDKTGILRSRRD